MRKVLALLLAAAAPALPAAPVDYVLDPQHSWVQWEVAHFGTSTIRGRFGPAEGVVTLDRAAGRGEVSVSLPTASVSTGIGVFDAHLRGVDLLDTATHPTAWLVARQLRFDGERLVELRGEFTWRGVSQPLTLTAQRFGCYLHPVLKREVCGGDFEGRLKRSDFGAGYGLPLVADAVTLRVQVEGVRTDAPAASPAR
ncbi:YceI family protein [uncultured Methylibium sp.]|uniref:YceI family protein n=1 Tax=uncultured Methylibium sp. TaxID=381093 RepID=UPI0025EC50C3|nr:YceI family protein [uncultured Methylibium sp.]